jgi:hypothetical protein
MNRLALSISTGDPVGEVVVSEFPSRLPQSVLYSTLIALARRVGNAY